MKSPSVCSAVADHHFASQSRRAEAAAVHRIWPAALPAASQANVPRLRPRSPQSQSRPHPARRHWPGFVGMLHAGRRFGRSCPKGYRTGSSVQTSLLPVVNSAASQPKYAKWIGSRQSPRLLPLYSPLMRQGPFPPPALPGFDGSTSPSAICSDRLCPSRAGRCRWNAIRSAPKQTSLVAHKSSRVPITTTPAERSGAYLARLPDRSGLPRYYGESASAWNISEPARCSLSLRPTRCAALLTESFS